VSVSTAHKPQTGKIINEERERERERGKDNTLGVGGKRETDNEWGEHKPTFADTAY
jgi:hypothetical protein